MAVAVLLKLISLANFLAVATLSEQMQKTPELIFAALTFSLSLACLLIWRATPEYRVLLTIGLFFAVVCIDQVNEYRGGTVLAWFLLVLSSPLFVETAAEVIKIRKRSWTKLLWPVYLGVAVAGWLPQASFVRYWPLVISETSLMILVIQGFRFGTARERLPACVFLGYALVRLTLVTRYYPLLAIPSYLIIGGWRWPITSIAGIIFGGLTLAIVIRDLIRDRREKMRLSMEIEAARLVQQVLIPEEIPSIAGFAIRAVYKPFGEVGGDFFQILPTSEGGVLVVIGDVSGKGMPAAMTVSLLVGTIRTLARYTQSPAEILTEMNQRMLGRSKDGFTTCLVLRVDTQGLLTIANAGHISPYLTCSELKIEGGLPLGLAGEATYAESTFALGLNSQLTLVTDGVVEARNPAGELLGFERTAALASEAAETIAQRAKEFGQNDDITVLTVVRLAVAKESVAEVSGPVLSPSLA